MRFLVGHDKDAFGRILVRLPEAAPGGQMYSLERARSGKDPNITPLMDRPVVVITDKQIGEYTPAEARGLAARLMEAARFCEARVAGPCRACGMFGCRAFHEGQIRQRDGTQYKVVREVKNGWRLEPIPGGKARYVSFTAGQWWPLVGWAE